MKTQHYIFTLIVATLLFFSCLKENRAPFIPTNHLADFVNEKSQVINLDTLEFKKIIGKHGTQIIYHRDLLM